MTHISEEMKGIVGTYSGEGGGRGWGFVPDGRGILIPLQKDDRLKIFADAAEEVVRWEGRVDLDATVTEATVTRFDRLGRPHKETVHCQAGFQRDMADEWADMMFDRFLRARLVQAEKPQP